MSDSFSGLRVSTVFAGLFLFALNSAAGSQCAEALRPAGPPPGSGSAKFLWLEENSPARTEWIRQQNHEMNAAMKQSPNAEKVSAWVKDLFSASIEKGSVRIDDKHLLKIVFRGLGRGTAIVLEETGVKSEILFTNNEISKKLTTTPLNLALSPDKNLVLITSVVNGSLDDYNHRVYDLKQRKIIAEGLLSSTQTPVWAADGASFYAQRWESALQASRFYRMDLQGKVLEDLSPGWIENTMGEWALLYSEKKSVLMQSGQVRALMPSSASSLIGVVGKEMYFLAEAENFGEIQKVTLDSVAGTGVSVVIPSNGRRTTQVKILGDYLVYQNEIGNDRKTIVADLNGQEIAQIPTPSYAAASAVSWEVPGKRLIINLGSTVTKAKAFTYDLEKKAFDNADKIEEALLTVDGVPVISEVVEATSADGTKIPVRLTYRKDLVRDASHGALLEVYGGFNLEGYFRPRASMLNKTFVMKGNVLVHPAVRGGNEFGPDWWKAAMLLNKEKTFDDTLAAARLVASMKLSQPNKTILTGTSNGGMVTAATALKGSGDIGLAIPINGVEDLLHKEKLDFRMGAGWSGEWGNSRKAPFQDYIKSYAGVEQALEKDAPFFFILNGKNDSRVNPIHSWKLSAALDAHNVAPEKVRMAVINNSGHWVAAIGYQDQAAWRANTLIWTTIYDFLGQKF